MRQREGQGGRKRDTITPHGCRHRGKRHSALVFLPKDLLIATARSLLACCFPLNPEFSGRGREASGGTKLTTVRDVPASLQHLQRLLISELATLISNSNAFCGGGPEPRS